MPLLFQVLHVAVASLWYARFYERWGAHLVAAEQPLCHTQQEGLDTAGWRLAGHSPQHISAATDLPKLSCFPLCVDLLSSSLREAPVQGTSVILFNAAISREKGKDLISK